MPPRETDREIRERDQWTTKPLACPDGITRVVTMPLWYWTNLDWLCANGHFEMDHVLPWILETIQKHADIETDLSREERFQAMLQGCIFECFRRLFPLQNVGHPDNDNGLNARDLAPG